MNEFPEEAQVTGLLDQARAIMLCPTPPGRSAVSVENEAMVTEWLTWLRDVRGRAPNTTYNYASVAAKYLDLCVGDRRLDDVPTADVEAWLLRPREGRARGQVGTPATRARNVAVLKSMYRWLHARGYATRNLGELLTAPTVHNRQPRSIDDATWLATWGRLRSDSDVVLFGLGFFCGLRRAELVALGPPHVDLLRGRLVNFPRKGGHDDTFPMVEVFDVFSDFMPHLWGDDGRARLEGALERRLGHDTIVATTLNGVNQRMRRLGVPFTPHALRHSFVTNLLRAGAPIELVADLAAHSSITVTMRYVRSGGGRVNEWRQSAAARLRVGDWR